MGSTVEGSISKRGSKLAADGGMRDAFKQILGNPYDPNANPGGFVNIGTAENYTMLEEVAKFAQKNLTYEGPDFNYGEGPWGSPRLRKAMANHMNKYFNPLEPVDPEGLLFANGCTSLFEMLGFVLCDPGDAILYSQPAYQAFEIDFALKADVKAVFTPFHGIDQFSPDCISKYEEALKNAEASGIRIRGLMLCNPHNPLGQCYPPSTLIELLKFCSKHQLHLISDEIYALSVYSKPSSKDDTTLEPFTSILSIDYKDYINPELLHVLYGFSKDFASGGLRLGCIYTPNNKALMRGLSSAARFHWASMLSDKLAALILEDSEWMEGYNQLSIERLGRCAKFVKDELDVLGIEHNKGANAGFFLWLDLRRFLPIPATINSESTENGEEASKVEQLWKAEDELAKRILDNGVFLTAGKGIRAEEPGFFRLCFANEEEILREGLGRLSKALGIEYATLTVR